MNNRSAFIDIIIFNNNFFFLSIKGYKVFILFFEGLVSTVDNIVDKFIIKFNISLELLFLRKSRRVKEFLIDTANITASYIF